MADVKRLQCSLYFLVLRDYWNLSTFQLINRVLLKPVLGGMAVVPPFITGHEYTQVNRFCYFYCSGILLPKHLTIIQNLLQETRHGMAPRRFISHLAISLK